MKFIFTFLLLLSLPTIVFSQHKTIYFDADTTDNRIKLKRNAVYGEFLGNGGSFVSANYERLFHFKNATLLHIAPRIGFSFSTSRGDNAAMYNIPTELNGLIGKLKHFAEIGFGWTAFIGTSDLNNPKIPAGYRTNFDYDYFFRIGYRFMAQNGLVLRAAPLLALLHDPPQNPNLTTQFGLGLSIGYCFNFK